MLQWAQYGTPLEELIELTQTTTNTDDENDSDTDMEVLEDVDKNTSVVEAEGEEEVDPDWAQDDVETKNESSGTDDKDEVMLMEMDSPPGLKVDLRPYQKQALYWMTERERDPDFREDAVKPGSRDLLL